MSAEFEALVLGLDVANPETQNFMERHQVLVQGSRERFAGSLALLLSDKEAGLREHFGPDFSRLSDEQLEFLRQPSSDDVLKLREQFLPDRTVLGAVQALDKQRRSGAKASGEEIRIHQQEILDDILAGLSAGHKEGHVELATAGGKAYLIAKLADAFAQAGLRCLILAPTKPIARQLVGENGEQGLGKFASTETLQSVGKQFAGEKAKPTDKIVISTYQSLIKSSNGLGQFDVFLCDEFHRALGEVTKQSVKAASPHAVKIGFTATPRFGANKSVDEVLPYSYHSLGLREAIDNGIVSPAQCLIYATGEEIRISDPRHRDFSERELRRLIHLKSRNEHAIGFAQNFVEEGRQGIIACVPGSNLAHARLLAEELSHQEIVDSVTGQKRKMVARAVGGGIMTDEEQIEVLQAYENGEIDVLTFVNLLGEGWDSQKASFLINACPTTSLVKITQQIGRVIRPKAGGQHAIIVDFLDSVIGKEQKTALQALGEEQVNLNKIYGLPAGPLGIPLDADTYLQGILDADLYRQLQIIDGRLVTDLTLTGDSRLQQRMLEYYERILNREGLHADTHLLGLPPSGVEAVLEAEDEFIAAHCYSPNDEELLEELGDGRALSASSPAEIRRRLKFIRYYREFGPSGLLLNLADGTGNAAFWTPVYGAETLYLTRVMKQTLKDELDEREVKVLALRFGLEGGQQRTLDEVGERLDLTRERIRQLETRAMTKLRGWPRRDTLRNLLEEDLVPDNKWEGLSLLKQFSEEPLEHQAMVLEALAPASLKYLLAEHRQVLKPTIQQYLAFLVNYQSSHSPEVTKINNTSIVDLQSMNRDIKQLLNGDFNAYLRSMDEQERAVLSSHLQTKWLNNTPTPTSLKGRLERARKFRSILLDLEYSEYITDRVIGLHRQFTESHSDHRIPAPEQIAEFRHRTNGLAIDYVSTMLQRWRLPVTLSHQHISILLGRGVAIAPYGIEINPAVQQRELTNFIDYLARRVISEA